MPLIRSERVRSSFMKALPYAGFALVLDIVGEELGADTIPFWLMMIFFALLAVVYMLDEVIDAVSNTTTDANETASERAANDSIG